MRRIFIIAAVMTVFATVSLASDIVNPTQGNKSNIQLPSGARETLRAYLVDVQAVMLGGNRDEKLAKADLSLTNSSEALLNSDKLDLNSCVNLTTKMGFLLARARFLSNPNPSWIFKKEDFVAAQNEYDTLLTYLQAIANNTN